MNIEVADSMKGINKELMKATWYERSSLVLGFLCFLWGLFIDDMYLMLSIVFFIFSNSFNTDQKYWCMKEFLLRRERKRK